MGELIGKDGKTLDAVMFYAIREDGRMEKVSATFNGLADEPYQPQEGRGPYLFELGPEEKAARMAALLEGLK